MLTNDEVEGYRGQVRNWLGRLGQQLPQAGATLVWHYTDGNGMLGILRDGVLWSTQASCLNDASEVRYGAVLLQSALRRQREASSTDATAAFIDRFADALDDSDDQPNQAASSNYVACFSLLKDDLSQWRSYGGGENGYCLGVQVSDLLNVEGTILGTVNYDGALHKEMANEIAVAIVDAHRARSSVRQEDELPKWEDAFFECWNGLLSVLAAFVKHPSFASEQELRLNHRWDYGKDLDQLVVRQKATMLARHLRLSFPAGQVDGKKLFPVREIVVGPARHKAISEISLKLLLQQLAYPAVVVSKSVIPFQMT